MQCLVFSTDINIKRGLQGGHDYYLVRINNGYTRRVDGVWIEENNDILRIFNTGAGGSITQPPPVPAGISIRLRDELILENGFGLYTAIWYGGVGYLVKGNYLVHVLKLENIQVWDMDIPGRHIHCSYVDFLRVLSMEVMV